MSLPNITFVKGQGGLGRPLPGEDFISGLMFYTNSLPSGFDSNNRIKEIFSPQDAINLGILNDYSDGTAATASYLITNDGAAGDIISISVKDVDSNGNAQSTLLCQYVRLSSDSTIALLGASIAAAINANTINNGYSASFLTATLTITASKKFGVFLNSGSPLVVAITGTIAGTITQFSGGIASVLAFYYYHISEFFRMQPQGFLFVGFFAVPGSYTFVEIQTLQNFANGKIRQIGVYKDLSGTWTENDITAIQASAIQLDAIHKPVSSIVYAADLTGTADITTLPDLNLHTAYKVSAVIGQDAGGQGHFLFITTGKSVSILGAVLGTIALSKVSESIAWVGKFNLSDGNEDEVLGFANGQYFNNSSISSSLDNILNALNSKQYIFLRKLVGISGSYINDSNCAIVESNDYSQIENNRTIDKAIRGIYTSMLPSLNSPLQLNADGTLSETTIAAFESQAIVNLDQMVRDAELSAFEVLIDPTQDVLATSTIVLTVELVINGVARQILVNIGFTPKLS